MVRRLMAMSVSVHACSVCVPMPVYAEEQTWFDAYDNVCVCSCVQCVCVYRGQVYAEGQTWFDACDCICLCSCVQCACTEARCMQKDRHGTMAVTLSVSARRDRKELTDVTTGEKHVLLFYLL